jgi:phosphoglycolate phosphatase-like HAD superfamily hydrolase
MYTKADLEHFEPKHGFFVGIDSDGCVFDTMEVKQKDFFHPLMIELWGLEAIEVEARQVAEFVNLYSIHRGQNRFPALLKTFELLREWPEVVARGVALPPTESLRAYVESGLPLGNPSLVAYAEAHPEDDEIARVREWSLTINERIDREMAPISPFEGVYEMLAEIRRTADSIVVSQTPEETLVKEWRLHGMERFVRMIAGQELGTKREHLELAAVGRYDADAILLIGDAPGDLLAAEQAGVLFYPIIPGEEEASWARLRDEAYDRFHAGHYAGTYQESLVKAFRARLPDVPPWVGR